MGQAESAVDGPGEFPSLPIPYKPGETRMAALMFSTAEKAREFIAANPGDWHVRQLDQRTLRAFLIDPGNRAGIDSVVIDFLNTGVPSFIQGFDADAGAKALEANGCNDDELAAVESWTVFL